MKVLFIASGGKTGKISNLTKAQADSIISRNIEVDIFPIVGSGPAAYVKHIPRIRKKIQSGAYDVLHAHYGLSAITARLAALRKPLVVSFMGSDIYGQPGREGTYRFSSRFFSWLSRFFARFFFDFTIVKSQKMREMLFKKTKFELIPNGVNLDIFLPVDKETARRELKLDPEKKYVFFAGKPEAAVKNYPLADAAVKKLEEKGLQAEIIYASGVDHSGVNLFMNAADALLLTSYHEGSPNVIKEALAVGMPIVSTNVGDVEERIEGVKGCYLCSYDPDDAAEKLKLALAFQGRTNGREAIKELDSRIIADRIIGIYEKLLKEHS